MLAFILIPIFVAKEFKLLESAQLQLGRWQQYLTADQVKHMEWENLRIHFEYLGEYDDEIITLLDQVMETAQTFFAKHILIRRQSGPIAFRPDYDTVWNGFVISEKLRNKVYDADYVFFVNVEYASESYLAYAGPAYFDENTLRPIMGLISWNAGYLSTGEITKSKFEHYVETAIHEIIHGLGFLDVLFKYYYDFATLQSYKSPTYVQNGTLYLRTPRLLKTVQKHFNCLSANGVPMEQDGGQGSQKSHFERAIFMNEIMTASALVGDFVFSDFTFEFLQDTGFYRIAEYNPDINVWGRKEGCGFLQKQCRGGTFKEFCKAQSVGCSQDSNGIGVCVQDPFANGCQYYYVAPSLDCRDPDSAGLDNAKTNSYQYFGYDSTCVAGSLSKNQRYQAYSCYQFKCSPKNQVTMIIDHQEFQCTDNKIIQLTEYGGQVTCAESKICQDKNECPNNCNKRGYCTHQIVLQLFQQCTCNQGYSGYGCENQCNTYRYNDQCISRCPDHTFAIESIKYCVGCPANCYRCTSYNKCSQCMTGYLLAGGFCDQNVKQQFSMLMMILTIFHLITMM